MIRPLSKADQESIRGHLYYEVKMSGALYGWTLKYDREGPAVLKNACLEATLVHVRCLIEFLAGRPRNGKRHWSVKDIQPAHFVSNWTPTNRFDVYLELADKHISHMSLDRANTAAPKDWALERMINEVLVEVKRFADFSYVQGSVDFATGLRIAEGEARRLMTTPPEDWPPSIESVLPYLKAVTATTTTLVSGTSGTYLA